MEKSFKSIGKNFRDDLVDDIAQANGSKLMNRRSTQLFGNKGYKSMIFILKKPIISKKIPDIGKNIPNNMPIFLIKKRCKAIQTQGICRTNTSQDREYFLLRRKGA
jgi:hypothetical protein